MSKKAIKQDEPLPRLQAESYTPGPWFVRNLSIAADKGGGIGPTVAVLIDRKYDDAYPTSGNELKCTARLIAAAPELLKACEDALVYVERAINEHNNAGTLLEAMKYAIRKATKAV